MTKALEAIANRMDRISNTLDLRDLGESWADVDAYIDALFDFEHITEEDRGRLQRDSRTLRDETAVKLKKRTGNRR